MSNNVNQLFLSEDENIQFIHSFFFHSEDENIQFIHSCFNYEDNLCLWKILFLESPKYFSHFSMIRHLEWSNKTMNVKFFVFNRS
jgi:hypothetical protein